MPRKILVLYAHPSPRRSQANARLARIAREMEGVTLVDLYAAYPDYQIDVAAEQAQLDTHDAILFLCPFYWYSTPSILKEWQDLVLEYGYAYGAGGTALSGKLFGAAITAGGSDHAYSEDGHNRFEIRDLLRPLEATANLCGMTYLPPLVLFSALTAEREGRLAPHGALFRDALRTLQVGGPDLAAFADAPTLNAVLTREEAAP
ncbi:MAG: NAD(P)H-dependent oxidoreductase [Pseudomonadota bacterium]